MEREKELDDVRLRSLLKESRLEMPFSDFEGKLMQQINASKKGKASIIKNLKLSWLFFLMGSIIGIAMSILVPMLPLNIAGVEMHVFKYPILVIVLFVIMWQFDSMLKLTSRCKNDHLE